LRRGRVTVVDVAGIEETVASGQWAVGSAEASIAAQMRGQAERELREADVVVAVLDATDARPGLDLDRSADLVVISKVDLVDGTSSVDREGRSGQTRMSAPPNPQTFTPARAPAPSIFVSGKSGEGIDALRDALDQLAFGEDAPAGSLAINARHAGAIGDAREALARAADAADAGPELAALELREALDALGAILGKVSPDDLLGRVFSQFCIGK
jgi:tRNA modification GTPase